MFSALCWRCACRLRELNFPRRAWGQCRAPGEVVVLAAKLFHLTPARGTENNLLGNDLDMGLLMADGSSSISSNTDSTNGGVGYNSTSGGSNDNDNGGGGGGGGGGGKLVTNSGSVPRPLYDVGTESLVTHSAVEVKGQELATVDTSGNQLNKDVLRSFAERFSSRVGIKEAAEELGVPDIIYQSAIQGFTTSLTDPAYIDNNTHLRKLIINIIAGSAHLDDLFPYFMKFARGKYPALTVMPELQKISNLTRPHMWYPRARSFKRRFIFHAGPTNSGKTHNALEQFLQAQCAIYCAPLRMLAHEIYQRSNRRGTLCDLVTGEEKQFASGSEDVPANHRACTVEMADLNSYYDVAVVDEVQMIQDEDRGGAWTRAILGLPAQQIHLCGHESAVPLIQKLTDEMGDDLEVCKYERLSPLLPLKKSMGGEFRSIRPGDCMVVFSRRKIFQVRRKIEQATKEPCAVIYGGLPSVTRVQQADLFNESINQCRTMVATDAIGMGLNLNIRRVIFYDIRKFDGRQHRSLTSAHVKQIAGRAGRYGLEHGQGEVTTFFEQDLEEFHKLLACPEDDIKTAGIYPTYEQIEHFSHLLPRASFLEILTLFFKMAQLERNYFLCDVQGQMDIAAKLKHLKLTLRDMYILSTAPAERENHLNVLYEYASDYSRGEQVTYQRLCEIVNWPQRSPLSPIQLAIFEIIHESIDLYLWLCMRFPEYFVAPDEARELQKNIQNEIAQYIVNRSRPRAVMHKIKHEDSSLSDSNKQEMSRRLNGKALRPRFLTRKWKKRKIN